MADEDDEAGCYKIPEFLTHRPVPALREESDCARGATWRISS